MAKRRYRAVAKRYVSRGSSYARRGTRVAAKSVDMSMETISGIVVGWSDLDNKIPADLVVLGATAPLKGAGMVGKGQKFFRGVMFGNRLKQIIGGSGINRSGYGV